MRVNGGMLIRHCIATAANQSRGILVAMKSTKKLPSVADARKAKSLISTGLKNRYNRGRLSQASSEFRLVTGSVNGPLEKWLAGCTVLVGRKQGLISKKKWAWASISYDFGLIVIPPPKHVKVHFFRDSFTTEFLNIKSLRDKVAIEIRYHI